MKLIPLTKGKFAIVDDADFDWLNQWKWCAWKDNKGKNFYAVRGERKCGKTVLISMHGAVFGSKGVDHKDGNGLNNQRENLRAANKSQNAANQGIPSTNTSGFKGVYWTKDSKNWRARIEVVGKNIHLGYFKNPADAARAYDESAIRLFGEFAKTNMALGLLTQ